VHDDVVKVVRTRDWAAAPSSVSLTSARRSGSPPSPSPVP